MNFKEYEDQAMMTRQYPASLAFPYVVLGLCGETGEFFEKLLEPASKDLILKEIGDVLWYTAAIRVELDLKPFEWPIAASTVAGDSGFYIQKEVGVVAEQMKKYIRDDWKEHATVAFPEERKEKIHAALSNVLQYFQNIANFYFDKSLESIAEANLKKLAIRKEHNCIHGSGDKTIR